MVLSTKTNRLPIPWNEFMKNVPSAIVAPLEIYAVPQPQTFPYLLNSPLYLHSFDPLQYIVTVPSSIMIKLS